ncbi:MAG: glycosyltransferase family 4 protein [Bacteroidales bacterium]|nr:glycosyltransferase family 4 protein [Bacteroidales bacterium]
MNILQIANKAIYPPDGGSLAILSMSKGYIRNNHHVHLLNMTTHKHYNNLTVIENEYKDSLEITSVKVDTNISILKLLFNLFFSKKPYIAKRFYSRNFSEKIIELLNNKLFDLVQIEGLYTLQYIHIIKSVYKGKIVYRPHNAEFKIWEANYKESHHVLKKIYFKILSEKLKAFEQSLLNQYDYILPISDIDAETFQKEGNTKPSLVSPYGIDIKKLIKTPINNVITSQNQINYIGALDWIPNQEGLIWFIDHCFPLVLDTFPGIKFNIAGRNAPFWFIKKIKHNNIKFIGEVENAFEFIQSSGPIIVPLFSGSGLRIKIIEAMALRKVVVATTIAACGIDCTNNLNIVIADNAEDFAVSIIKTLQDQEFQKETGKRAFEFVNMNFDFENISDNIINFIKQN